MTESQKPIKNRLISFEKSLKNFFSLPAIRIDIDIHDYVCYNEGALKEIMDNLDNIIKDIK